MKPGARLGLALFALLALALAVLAPRVARRLELGGALRLELARVRPTRLEPETVAAFERLSEPVLATYYVSAPAALPTEMKSLPRAVEDLFAALERRFPARFAWSLVDPGARAELPGFSSRRTITPFQVRSVAHDRWSERTVYSTLELARGDAPSTLVRGLAPEQLPHLQELLVAWLAAEEAPRAPRLALASPANGGFDELADAMSARGTLTRVDLDAGEPVPECDALLWMAPRRVTGDQLRQLEERLARGACVLIAGSAAEADERVREDVPYVTFRPGSLATRELAAHFGLEQSPSFVCDTTAEELEFGAAKIAAPHWVRAIAPDQDFRGFASQPNGTLLFRAGTGFQPEPARLFELGLSAQVLAATTDGAWLADADGQERRLASLARDESRAVAKQALLVALRPAQPWQGTLVFAAAPTPFEDGFFHRERVAHGRLLDVLLDDFTARERLLTSALATTRPEVLPAFAPAARFGWRLFALVMPVLLLLFALHGRELAGGARTLAGVLALGARRAWRPILACAIVAVGVREVRAVEPPLDATAEKLHTLAAVTRATLEESTRLGPLTARWVVSSPARLPPELRGLADALPSLLEACGRAGLAFELVHEDADALSAEELAARALPSHVGAVEDDGVTRATRYVCALELARGERRLVLDFADARAFERLEYRLVDALRRLAGAPATRVAFASDVPRLSAAEAYEQYQQKSLFAPRGTDVYALARAALAAQGLEVVHVNPRAPVLPDDFDVLVWLQPRRAIDAMLEATVRTLVGGGKVVLAAQHFQLKPQQFRGRDFALGYWPEPQSSDLENLYFPELSIEPVREILFDRLSVPIATTAELTGRGAQRVFERQSAALAFQIRLSAAHFAAHPALRGLSDQAFLWANRLRWDEARLAELGLTATVLATTSEQSWSYAWSGGWVPDELLAGPAASAGYLGRQPLAALFEGTFPRPTKPLTLNPPAPDAAPVEEEPWPASAPGKLLWLGCSQFLTNERLVGDEFRGDQLLWNAVATLAFEPELAELATRTRARPGFGVVAREETLAWRAGVVAGPVVLVALAALLVAASRARRSPRFGRVVAHG